MQELVSVDLVKQHLRRTDIAANSTEESLLQIYLDQAHAIVADYVNQRRSDGDAWAAEIDAWTEDTAPKQVLAAILRMTAHLYRFRGDDDSSSSQTTSGLGELPRDVTALLYGLRDPSLA
jgi:hypothetical protein